MPSIKLHVYRTEMGDDGTESCDYRGKGEHGAGQNDQHRTIGEIDPATEDQIHDALEAGPAMNRQFAQMVMAQPSFAGAIASVLGLEGDGPVGLRLGVWDQ